jgi:hypothetical protein
MICTPASISQGVGLAHGAQAGEKRLREVVMESGFRHFRRATETPFKLVLEAKPWLRYRVVLAVAGNDPVVTQIF